VITRPRVAVILAVVLMPVVSFAQTAPLAARIAEILEATEGVEINRGSPSVWTAVRTGQELVVTDAIRTRPLAYARIKFQAGLQWMLREQSLLQLRAATGANANAIQVRLDSGKAIARWTPDRRPEARTMTQAIVETPSGQASIQGTEWSLSVDEDGRTALVVLEGAVELSNALASITVRANEAAEMRVGQPPTLLRVISPRDRVQWVADYSARPMRFADASLGGASAAFDLAAADASAGRSEAAIDRLEGVASQGAPAGVLLALTDLLIEAADLERARVHAEAGRRQFPADARFDAMLSRIALFDDRTVDSRALANEATVKDPAAVEGWLALGESARNDGDGALARRAFQRATTVNPGDARGWFGLGSVETEYEAFVPARRWLGRALELDPKGPGYRGELGTVETLANHFDAAEREFTQALADRPGDYVAMTGRALLALKEGREAEALDLLLRATLIEPRYARAHVYLGVTYYRLRRHDDAVRALRKASQLDPKDPLPYLMESAIYTDVYEPAKAMAAGRRARDLMPNLKSLNQLASTQKGTANLGNSLAFMGMEQWSQHLAQESYSPFWAGSHLFLGDRYSDAFARTSEYYQGLLTDPTVFGGSPMFQTLLPRAGQYLSGDVSVSEDTFDVRSVESVVSVNGYRNRRFPIGYAVSARGSQGWDLNDDGATRRPAGGSAAVGASISPRLSFFFSGAIARESERFRFASLARSGEGRVHWVKSGQHVDAGFNFRPSPASSLAVRAGQSRGSADLPLTDLVPQLSSTSAPADVQARYTRLLSDRLEISAGTELASDRQELHLTILGFIPGNLIRKMQSAQLFASARLRWTRLLLQADLSGIRESIDFMVTKGNPYPDSFNTHQGLQARIGAAVRFGPAVVRGAWQQRTRPRAAASTLGPVATAGIPIDDELVELGGEQRRLRAQLEWELSSRTFVQLFAERQRLENRVELNFLEDYLDGLQSLLGHDANRERRNLTNALSDLRGIARDASHLNVTALSLLEGDPNIAKGHVSAYGGALNRVLSTRLSLSARYAFRPSSGTSSVLGGADLSSAGTMLTFVPRHTSSLGLTWIHPRRVYLSAEAIHRSERFSAYVHDPITTVAVRPLRPADWTARLAGSWESRDKRWALEVVAADLLSTHVATTYAISAKVRR
jgi:Flp pilus assembly protein TadD